VASPSKPAFRRSRLFLIGFIGLLLLLLVEPHLLRGMVRYGLIEYAKRHQVELSIGKMEGNLFSPLSFYDVTIDSSRDGVASRTRITSAEAVFSWSALLLRRGTSFFNRLTLSDLDQRLVIQPETADAPAAALPPKVAKATPAATPAKPAQTPRSPTPWLPLPTRLDLWNGTFHSIVGDRRALLSGVRLHLNQSEPGRITVGELHLASGPSGRVFRHLSGTTVFQGTRLVVGDVRIADDLLLKTVSTDLADLARGHLRAAFDFAAFDGALRGEVVSQPGPLRSQYEIAGNFSQISVPSLARFLSVREKTGGTIKEGKFTFRGSPQALEQATLSVRLEATDFLWDRRQWNSLVVGAMVVNGRVEIPELELHQAENSLTLSGELLLPEGKTPWWESQFRFDLHAKIDNLTELSSLFGPRFSDTAGKISVVGAIRGKDRTYHGQLIVSGSNLAFRGAPVEVLNAAIKLDGNEIQVINLEIANGRDFVRGKGSVNIYGEKRYQAELKAAIDELSLYESLLRKPVAPVPLAGGVVLDWSGDGTFLAHSGAFTAKFRKLHTPGNAEIPATLPIDAELEGTYAPGGLFLNKCVLAEEKTRLETRLAANPKTLDLSELRLTHHGKVWLEGEATLPVNLFRFWLNPGVAALVPDAPFKVQLQARDVQLADVANLTGHPIPLKGILSGQFRTEGTLLAPAMKGALRLTSGSLPENRWMPALEGIEAEATFDGPLLHLSRVSADHPLGKLTAEGSIDLTTYDQPRLDLALRSGSFRFQAGEAWSGSVALDLRLTGTPNDVALAGTARPVALTGAPTPEWGRLLREGNGSALNLPAPALALAPPLDAWRLDLAVQTGAPVDLPIGGDLETDLRYAGKGEIITPTGRVTYTGLPLRIAFTSGTVESASFLWVAGESEPRLAVRVAARTADVDFLAYYLGSVSGLSGKLISEPERTEADLRLLLTQGYVPLSDDAADFTPTIPPLFFAATASSTPPDEATDNHLLPVEAFPSLPAP